MNKGITVNGTSTLTRDDKGLIMDFAFLCGFKKLTTHLELAGLIRDTYCENNPRIAYVLKALDKASFSVAYKAGAGYVMI